MFFVYSVKKQKNNRKRTGEGLTKMKQYVKTRQARVHKNNMDSPVTYPRFKWAKFNSKEYLQAINEINDMYRKMIMIGKSREVFHDKVCPKVPSE